MFPVMPLGSSARASRLGRWWWAVAARRWLTRKTGPPGLLLAVAVSALFAGIARGDDKAPAPPDWATAFHAFEPVHDFGRVNGGDLLSHEFPLTNASARPVRISGVDASCSCVVVGEWPRELAPGGAGGIPFVFHTVNYRGPVTETLTVNTDDPDHPSLRLELKADVWRPVELIPPAALFEIDPGSPALSTATVRVLNQTEEPLSLGAPEPSHRALVAELTTNSPGREYQVTIRLKEPFPPGNLFGAVRLKTSVAKIPLLEIPVYATQAPVIAITPKTVRLPAGKITNQFTAIIRLRSRATNAFQVSSPLINLPGVGVALEETQVGRAFAVKLSFPAGFELPADTRAELTLRSNQPQQPQIRVPVTRERPAPPSAKQPENGPRLPEQTE